MCAVFGFSDYGKKVPSNVLKNLLRALSYAAESRGIDATGISYVNDRKIVTFKKAKPAHKVKLYFPKNVSAVIGHTRFTTQGSELCNYNNHPFIGHTSDHAFSLAHNGVLDNDAELRKEKNLPETKIETDSYIAVQLIEHENKVDFDSIKNMAETVKGNFVFTILRDDNTLFLVKGNNPVTILHYPELDLYVYASTDKILSTALKAVNFTGTCKEVPVNDGDIVTIDSKGNLTVGTFEYKDERDYDSYFCRWFSPYYMNKEYDNYKDNDILTICGYYGVSREDVELLLDLGYCSDEIEEMLTDRDLLEKALAEIKMMYKH